MYYELGRCRLDDCLANAGMKRQDIVESTGISRQRLSSYARNKTVMMPETLFTIASAIGCSDRELYVLIEKRGTIDSRQITKKTDL